MEKCMRQVNSYQAKDGFIAREIAGEMLLVPTGTRTQEFNGMICLNETGIFLWEAIQTPKTVDELVEILIKEFETTVEEAKSDILDFIKCALDNQLIFEL